LIVWTPIRDHLPHPCPLSAARMRSDGDQKVHCQTHYQQVHKCSTARLGSNLAWNPCCKRSAGPSKTTIVSLCAFTSLATALRAGWRILQASSSSWETHLLLRWRRPAGESYIVLYYQFKAICQLNAWLQAHNGQDPLPLEGLALRGHSCAERHHICVLKI